MSEFHKLDKYGGKWTDEELKQFFIFCILDRATSYQKICDACDALIRDWWNGSIRASFSKHKFRGMSGTLKKCGYRFYNQGARFIIANCWVTAKDLRTWSRKEMVENCPGIGMKLSSMFLRNTRELQYAVIDTHIKQFMERCGIDINQSYEKLEKEFKRLAKMAKLSVYELDMAIGQDAVFK
jgi:thermostable 8-oxoguanine DNA glycosylase